MYALVEILTEGNYLTTVIAIGVGYDEKNDDKKISKFLKEKYWRKIG